VANPQTCRVSFTDPEGVTHSVVVSAASVYEAAALAVAEFRRAQLADVIVGPGTRLQISVEAPAMSHELTFQKLTNWLGSSAKSPNDGLLKSRLREILGG